MDRPGNWSLESTVGNSVLNEQQEIDEKLAKLPKIPNTILGAPTNSKRGRPSHARYSQFKESILKIQDHSTNNETGVRFLG